MSHALWMLLFCSALFHAGHASIPDLIQQQQIILEPQSPAQQQNHQRVLPEAHKQEGRLAVHHHEIDTYARNGNHESSYHEISHSESHRDKDGGGGSVSYMSSYSSSGADQDSDHLDPGPDTIGLLFGAPEDEDAVHVWLPLGKRVYTRRNPSLPVHPRTARITTRISSAPEHAESLNAVRCSIFPRLERTTPGNLDEELPLFSFSKADEVVKFDLEGGESWLHSIGVDAYECS